MGETPRDFPEWMRLVDRRLRNNSRAAMNALVEVRNTVGAVAGDIDGIKDAIDSLPGTPTAPVELTGESSVYVDEKGRPLARVRIDFPDVVRTVTGQPITVSQYELQGYEQTATRLQDSRAGWPGRMYPGSTYPGTPRDTKGLDPVWTTLGTSDTSSFVQFGLPQGQVWVFRVRAAGGEWSAALRIETLKDTTPPPQPTAPVVEESRGTLVVRWDGMAVTGPQPADFETAVLVGGPDPSPGEDRELYRWGREGGTFVLPGVDYYETWFFRIRTMDQSGNWSVWSVQASGYPTPMVDADIILTELDAAKTHLKNVDAGVSILPDTIITEHLHVTESMSAAVGQFLRVKADMLEANDIWADSAWIGYAEARLVKADMFVGKEFEGGTFTGGTFRSGATGARTELTRDGLRQVDALGRELFKLGYGIETGMALRNPGTGVLTPISNIVFGATVATLHDEIGVYLAPGESPVKTVSMVSPTPYTATSSAAIITGTATAWTTDDSIFDGEYVAPALGKLRVQLRERGGGGAWEGMKYDGGFVQAYNTVLGNILGANSSVTWTQYAGSLTPGKVYDVVFELDFTRRPNYLNVVKSGATVVGVSASRLDNGIMLEASPSCHIVPR